MTILVRSPLATPFPLPSERRAPVGVNSQKLHTRSKPNGEGLLLTFSDLNFSQNDSREAGREWLIKQDTLQRGKSSFLASMTIFQLPRRDGRSSHLQIPARSIIIDLPVTDESFVKDTNGIKNSFLFSLSPPLPIRASDPIKKRIQ